MNWLSLALFCFWPNIFYVCVRVCHSNILLSDLPLSIECFNQFAIWCEIQRERKTAQTVKRMIELNGNFAICFVSHHDMPSENLKSFMKPLNAKLACVWKLQFQFTYLMFIVHGVNAFWRMNYNEFITNWLTDWLIRRTNATCNENENEKSIIKLK